MERFTPERNVRVGGSVESAWADLGAEMCIRACVAMGLYAEVCVCVCMSACMCVYVRFPSWCKKKLEKRRELIKLGAMACVLFAKP